MKRSSSFLDGARRHRLALGCLALVLFALPVRANEIVIDAVVPAQVEIETVVELVPVGREGEALSKNLRAPGRLAVELPAGDSPAAWKVELTAPGFWAPTKMIVPTDGDTISIRMHRTGTITGSVVPPAGDEVPPEVTVRWAA